MTTAFYSIGCCIDRSDAARAVLDEGIRLRELGDAAAIHLVHVVEPPPVLHAGPYTYVEPSAVAIDEAKEWMDAQVAAIHAAGGVVLDGEPGPAVCAWAESSGVDLLIAAPHRGVVDRILHGSFAAHLTYHAHCPVLMVRPASR